MGDVAKAGAAVVCCMLLLGQCSKDPITGAKAAVGGAAVGAGIGAGAAAGGAAAAAAKAAAEKAKRKPTTRPRMAPVEVTPSTVPQLSHGFMVVTP